MTNKRSVTFTIENGVIVSSEKGNITTYNTCVLLNHLDNKSGFDQTIFVPTNIANNDLSNNFIFLLSDKGDMETHTLSKSPEGTIHRTIHKNPEKWKILVLMQALKNATKPIVHVLNNIAIYRAKNKPK